MYEVFKEARADEGHPEHEWAKEAGYIDWEHDEVHSDVIAEQFAKLRKQKTRRTSRWVMGE